MPPNLALLMGLGLSYYALRTDARRATVVPGLFWPSLWYIVCATRPVGVWMVTWNIPVPQGDASGGGIDAMFFLALALIGLKVLASRGFSWGRAFRENPWITALILFMALSIFWSQYGFISFKRYLKIVGSISMALVVLTTENPLEAIFTVLRRCVYVHLPMSIICIKYFRHLGVSFDWSGTGEAWQGISTSKNTLGQITMLGVLYLFLEVRRNWPKTKWKNLFVPYLAMAVFLLKGSEHAVSMTSLSVSIFAVLVFGRLQSLRSNPARAAFFAKMVFYATVCLVSLVVAHSVFFFSQDSIFGYMITKFGRDITLTDRTNIWDGVYAAARGNPLLGVGFGGFWIGRDANIAWNATMTWVLGQAHNGYIDTYLQTGLLGASLLVATIFTTLPRLLRMLHEDFDGASFRITLFLTILFVNITETTFLRGDHHLWFILQLVLWSVPSMYIRSTVPEPETADDEAPTDTTATPSESHPA